MDLVSVDPRREAWERRAEWPLMLAALGFLVSYAWPILDLELSRGVRAACDATTWITWGVFAVDYCARLILTEQRMWFVRRNLFDLAVIVLPLFRPLRLLRLVTLVRVFNRQTSMALRGRVAVYVTGSAVLVIFCAALATLDAERQNPEANIASFPDALWWAATTVTTVGYGDRYPTTVEGRWIATALMLAGIALLGVVTATLAHWFIEQVRDSDEMTRSEIEELTQEVVRLREQIEALATGYADGNAKVPSQSPGPRPGRRQAALDRVTPDS
jgi:voltage-gated potassium channel